MSMRHLAFAVLAAASCVHACDETLPNLGICGVSKTDNSVSVFTCNCPMTTCVFGGQGNTDINGHCVLTDEAKVGIAAIVLIVVCCIVCVACCCCGVCKRKPAPSHTTVLLSNGVVPEYGVPIEGGKAATPQVTAQSVY